jgi:hypothetical protein
MNLDFLDGHQSSVLKFPMLHSPAILLGFIGFSILMGIIANYRGRSGLGYFLFSLLLSPIGALLLLLISRDPSCDDAGRRPNYPIYILALILIPTAAYIIYARIISPRDTESPADTALAMPHIQTPRPSAQEMPKATTAEQRAIQLYPNLAIANSELNQEFVRRYRRYKMQNPSYFNDPEWPTKLATESQATLQKP